MASRCLATRTPRATATPSLPYLPPRRVTVAFGSLATRSRHRPRGSRRRFALPPFSPTPHAVPPSHASLCGSGAVAQRQTVWQRTGVKRGESELDISRRVRAEQLEEVNQGRGGDRACSCVCLRVSRSIWPCLWVGCGGTDCGVELGIMRLWSDYSGAKSNRPPRCAGVLTSILSSSGAICYPTATAALGHGHQE